MSYFVLLFHDPYMKRIFIVERRHLQIKIDFLSMKIILCIEHKDVFITQVSNSQAEMEHG